MSLHDVLLPFDEVLSALPAGLADGRQVLDLAWIGRAWCEDLVVSAAEPDGRQVRARLILQTSSDLPLADLGLLTLTIPQTGGEIESVVRLRTGSRPGLTADVPLNLHINQPLLRRVDPIAGEPLGDGLDLQARASVSVDSNGPRVDFHALTIPPTMLGQTGIIVTLEGVELVFDGSALPDPLRSLVGNGPTHLLASRAVLRWLPQFVPALADLPGFTVPLRDIVVDDAGVSFVIDYTWQTRQNAAGHISPRSEAFGGLLDGQFRAALRRIVGEVSRNQPSSLRVEGLVEIPWLPGAADVSFFWNGGASEESRIDVSLQHPGVQLTVGGGQVEVNQIEVSGKLGETTLSVGGQARLRVALPGLAVGPVSAEFGLEGTSDRFQVTATLLDVPVGPLGRLSRATLALDLSETNQTWLANSVKLSADLLWSDVRALLAVANWPASIPQPPNDARVTVELKWDDPALDLTFRIESDASADLWRFLPPGYRPVTRRMELGIVAHFANAATFGATQPGAAIQADVVLLVEFKPFLPEAVTGNHLLELAVPDSEGFVTARVTLALGGTQGDSLEFQMNDVLALDAFVPFLETERSVVHAELQSLSMSLIAGRRGAADRLKLEASGTGRIRPPQFRGNDPLAQALNGLLAPLGQDGLAGTFTVSLETDGSSGGTTFTLAGTITEAQLDIDLLALLATLAPPQETSGSTVSFRGEVPLGTSVRFVLDGFTLRIGPPKVAGGPNIVSAELSVTAEIAGASVSTVIAISTEDLSIDFTAEIPLQVPRFPVSRANLNALATGGDTWWTLIGFNRERQALRNELRALDNGGRNEATRQAERLLRAELTARRQMLTYLRDLWSSLDADGRRRFQQGVEPLVDLLDAALGFTHVDSTLKLHIDHARLRVPWRAPQEIALEGGASLRGFSDDDPFRGLEGFSMGLGISPDQVYFTAEGSGRPIPLPDLGRYPGGTVSLTRFSIGYGFTRNSLAIAFAGSLNLPPQLIDDADLSDDLGFGIRLPSSSSLAFRLDIIPVPGPIPLVPSGEFALDLRTPGLPGIRSTAGCAPVWDGLQLHIPNLIHLDFKQASVSPLFGILPAMNARYDGDLELGNAETGVTVVCDDLLWIMGLGTPPSVLIVPLLFDPLAPFFENLCLNLRLLGFRLNIGVQRPFPQPNPLVIFEAMALAADPDREVDPDGPLANMVRVAIRDASLDIPNWLKAMVPGSRAALRNRIDFELDLGTVITIVQWFMEVTGAAIDLVESAFEAGQKALRDITAPPPDVSELLTVFPEQLRVFGTDFDFAGFRGRGAIALTSIRSVLRPNRQPQGRNRSRLQKTDLHAGLLANRGAIPALKKPFGGKPPVSTGHTSGGSIPTTAPFNQFQLADFEALPTPSNGADGILIAVELTVFEVARFALVGYVADTGEFGLVSTAGMRNGILRIAGIDVRLPLQFSGRASFAGRVAPNEVRASIMVGGFGVWDPIPNFVRLRLGSAAQPVEIGLSTDGRFVVQGSAVVDLFGGAFRLNGSVDASERHLMAKGDLAISVPRPGSNQPWMQMASSGALEVGPGQRFRFEGEGSLRLLNQEVASAHLRMTETEVEIGGKLETMALMIGGVQTQIFASISARAKLDDRGLFQMSLQGAGSIRIGPAVTEGSLEINFFSNRMQLKAAGEMRWMGQKWLSAAVSIATNGAFNLEGRTSLAIDIIDPRILGDIEVAKLFLRLDVRAAVDIDPDGGLGSYDFGLEWSIGVKLPGAQGQTFVLAMQKERFQGGGRLEVILFSIDGISFLPAGNIQIPIPQLVPTDFRNVYATYIDLPVLDQIWFLTNYELKNWIEDNIDQAESKYLFEIPVAFEPRIENTTLAELAGALKFEVALVWNNNSLALAIRRDGEEKLIRFDTIR